MKYNPPIGLTETGKGWTDAMLRRKPATDDKEYLRGYDEGLREILRTMKHQLEDME